MFDHLPDFQDRFRSIVKESYPGELPRSKPRQNAAVGQFELLTP
jgi:hypothetical protein